MRAEIPVELQSSDLDESNKELRGGDIEPCNVKGMPQKSINYTYIVGSYSTSVFWGKQNAAKISDFTWVKLAFSAPSGTFV